MRVNLAIFMGWGYIVPYFAGWLKSIMGKYKPLFQPYYEAQGPINVIRLSVK